MHLKRSFDFRSGGRVANKEFRRACWNFNGCVMKMNANQDSKCAGCIDARSSR